MFSHLTKKLTILSKFPFSSVNTPYGREFASLFANTLEKRKKLFLSSDKGYCGVGFDFENGKFNFGRVWDGKMSENLFSFDQKEKFIEWISLKNDFKMSGYDLEDNELFENDTVFRGNQRIYKETIEEFIKQK